MPHKQIIVWIKTICYTPLIKKSEEGNMFVGILLLNSARYRNGDVLSKAQLA